MNELGPGMGVIEQFQAASYMALGMLQLYAITRVVCYVLSPPGIEMQLRLTIEKTPYLTGPRFWGAIGFLGWLLVGWWGVSLLLLTVGITALVIGAFRMVVSAITADSLSAPTSPVSGLFSQAFASPEGYVLPVRSLQESTADPESSSWIEVRRDTSTLLVGATRSGKSEASKLLVYQMVRDWEANEPLICYDRKSDWQEYCRQTGVRFEILSADRDETTVYWDLFDEIETERDIDRIARSLFEKSDSEAAQQGDDFFSVAARQVFAGILKMLHRRLDEPQNANIVKYVQQSSREQVYEDLNEYDDLRSAAQAIDPDAESQAAGVWATVAQETEDIFVGAFGATPVDGPHISLREYFENPGGTALILSHPHGFGSAVERIYSFLIDDAIRRGMVRDGGAVLVLDELPQLPQLENLDELVNVGAGEQVRTLITAQSVAQMRDTYGDDAATSLLAGLATKVLMRSGDPETTEFYRGVIGQRYQEVESETMNVSGISNVSQGTSTREEERHPFDEAALTSMEPGEAVIKRSDGWIHAQLPMLGECRSQIQRLADIDDEPPTLDARDAGVVAEAPDDDLGDDPGDQVVTR